MKTARVKLVLFFVFLLMGAINKGLSNDDGYILKALDDINPVATPIGSFPLGFTKFKEELYFMATGPNGRELYKTDGETVVELANIHPAGDAFASSGSTIGYTFTEFNDELYFQAEDEIRFRFIQNRRYICFASFRCETDWSRASE